MPAPSLDLLQSVLSGLSAGRDPSLLLHDALAGALKATGATGGAVLRVSAGGCTPVTSTGTVSAAALSCGMAAAESGRLVRRQDPATGLSMAAEPLPGGGRRVGALVVAGRLSELDFAPLGLYAAAAALVVDRQMADSPDLLPELLASLSAMASDLDTHAMSARVLDTAHVVFGAASGLCALSVDGTLRVSQFRGIDAERLVDASRHPEFRDFLTGDGIRVDAADHPVVRRLSVLDEVAVGMPLEAGGQHLGRLVLLMPSEPGPAGRSLLGSFARHVAVCLLASRLLQSVGDHQQRLSSLAHSVAQPVVLVDDEGRVVEVNGPAAQAFHLAPGFERGQPVQGRLGNPALEEMLTTGQDATAEVVMSGDEPRIYRASVRRMRTSEGRVTGRVLVLDDLTGPRRVDALMSDFVAVIGHELRTPLTVVKGYVQTLVRRGDALSVERRTQALAAVESNLTHLERMIEDLLFISAIEDRATVDLEPSEVGALLQEWSGPRVIVRVPPRPVEAAIDQAKLSQVLHQLIDNALKYSTEEIVVELADRGDAVEISVSDQGPGIFSGDVPHLFDRFRQLDGTSTRSHGGVGLGLYICRRVVEALGGRIWCDSRLGIGSRFAFTLPKVGVGEPVSR